MLGQIGLTILMPKARIRQNTVGCEFFLFCIKNRGKIMVRKNKMFTKIYCNRYKNMLKYILYNNILLKRGGRAKVGEYICLDTITADRGKA